MAKHRYDVVILGGGLVGSAMALALGGHGFTVALVDPLPVAVRGDPEFDGRAYAVAPGSRNLLGALGVWRGLAAKAEPVRKITVSDRVERPVTPAALHFDPAETAQEALGWIVEDRHLRAALLGRVAEAPVDHLAGVRALTVTRGTGWADVLCDDGETIQARLVVASDGRRSRIAREAGIEYFTSSYGQAGLVSAIEHERAHGGTAHQAFFPGGPFAVLPLAGNRSSLVWSEEEGQASAIAALDDAAYMAEVAERVGGRLGGLALAGGRWSYPLGISLALGYAVSRLVVAGDAAHGVHPIAGQGMNMGLRDVAALTEVLVEAARIGLDIGDLTVLEGYQRWRRFDATVMALGMDGLNRLFSTDAPAAQVVRNTGLRVVAGTPALRRVFMGEASGMTGEVPQLLAGKGI